ncbi:MAG: undecaprenyl/decaprenyl-phosphate alpha-N-acetylglucosaminyl 1-phosphate transferase [Acidobacteria bacterium]|nr:undecaprenyl/decaprenyl-phosphate alpha-N-acetylglucosaminyl 1-phosphate transferase [Acidobacteriota bacterium]
MAGLVFATGLIDDLRGLKPWQKLVGQTAGAALAFAGGVRIHAIGGFRVDPAWSFALTLLWLIACTNAFNLIDGVDGLAAGIGLFASVTALIASLLHGNVALALATAPLGGCLLAFLRYNSAPASIFLGDSGSLLIGFLLGCYGVIWSQKSATILGMTAPLMAFALPLVEMCLSIGRRFLSGQPIFLADHGHIHHQLLARGISPRKVVLLLYAMAGVGAVFSLLVLYNHFAGLVIVLFCTFVWIGVHSLSYVEFRAAGRVLWGGSFRDLMNAEIRIERLERAIAEVRTLEDCWCTLREQSHRFGFSDVSARLLGWDFEEPRSIRRNVSWHVRIPLPEGDEVTLGREIEPLRRSLFTSLYADAVRGPLASKLFELRPDHGSAAPRSELLSQQR